MNGGHTDHLVGRDDERERLSELTGPTEAPTLVLLGAPGLGKTALLLDLFAHAAGEGIRVLTAAGRAAEQHLAFAGLHELLGPVAGPGELPALETGPSSERPSAGPSVLALLSRLSEWERVLLVVDDLDRMDAPSREALAFVGHRLRGLRVTMAVAARSVRPPAGFDDGFPVLALGRLTEDDSVRLVDRQPHVPRGHARARVLTQAAGHPQALIELAAATAYDGSADRGCATEPLPLSAELAAAFGAQLAGLPEDTRAALLIAALGESGEAAALVDVRALTPAEERGIISVDRHGIRFAHPLLRSVVYHTAPFADRAAAHRRLAGQLADRPELSIWHLSAATLHPDEEVASQLEETAGRSGRARARVLERAAELSPDPAGRARRLTAAATAAMATGQADWVADLAERALASVSIDTESRLAARYAAGWSRAWTRRQTAAFPALLTVADEAASDTAVEALTMAATVAHQSGSQIHRDAIGLRLTGLGERGDASALWIGSCADPAGAHTRYAAQVRELAAERPTAADLPALGAAAWSLDESETAVELLQASRDLPGVNVAALKALGWAYLDTGRWDAALDVAGEVRVLAEAHRMDMPATSALLLEATVHALRGDAERARVEADRALTRVDPAESRLVTARARRAFALAAGGDASRLDEYDQYRRLFKRDGEPLHPRVSFHVLADLAAAAVRCDRHDEARILVEGALRRLGENRSPRLEQIIRRAQALLAAPEEAEAHFLTGLADAEGGQWPFERAQFQLDRAEWLRRAKRINEARPMLVAALETFRRLGALPWVRRAEDELRAAGTNLADAAPATGSLSALSPQERVIVRMAGTGMTNPQIAQELYLSPRTVASHLYRCFPKLGVTRRHQLRDLLAELPAAG